MKQSSTTAFPIDPSPSPFALQVKIFTHLISFDISGSSFA